MNTKEKNLTEALAALSDADLARLNRLAVLAKTTPEVLWPDVWHYGFDDIEAGIQADLDADADIAAGRLISNEEVMDATRRMIGRHVEREAD